MANYTKYTIVVQEEIDYLCQTVAAAPLGDVVVAGTYRGGDVMAIMETNPDRRVVVMDSFQGLADASKGDEGEFVHQAGDFNVGGMDAYLRNFAESGYALPHEIYPLWITPETLKAVTLRPISVLWLDLDHYLPTRACISYFWDSLVLGGKMLTHDYDWDPCQGVKRACDDSGLAWTLGKRTIAYAEKKSALAEWCPG